MKKYAVIVAGGSGLRMGSALPKQFLLLAGKPLLWHTITAFLGADNDMEIILVLPAQYMQMGHSIAAMTAEPGRIHITAGGETRFQSVKNGLDLIREDAIIFVHDGVRCLVTKELIQRCCNEAMDKGNAVPAVAATDSIRMETSTGNEVVDRNKIRIIQTPQTFLSAIIKPAFEQAYTEAFTDEASVVERSGVKINLIQGEVSNIKITRPVDLLMAEKILEEKSSANI